MRLSPFYPPPLLQRRLATAARRLRTGDGSPSIDGLDAAIRGFGVSMVVLLSLFGYGEARPGDPLPHVDPVLVAGILVVYNLAVITILGVPWRTTPGIRLFALDWLVASAAILLTGGIGSPFNLLYYALVIGAALRVTISRSALLVAGCALMYMALAVIRPNPVEAIRLPALVVQVTALVMVMFMAAGMKHAFEAEVRKVELEEQAANRLRLLNSLTTTVLAGVPDLGGVLRAIAAASSEAVQADSGLAVLYDPEDASAPRDAGESQPLIVADRDPNPATLSHLERTILDCVLDTAEPVIVAEDRGREHASDVPAYPGLERGGQQVCAIATMPFIVDGRAVGALFVGRYSRQPFTAAEINLLVAISQQLSVAVRLARLYDMEREKAIRSEQRERLERDLLSMVSHELRTPLTAIKTSVGALTEEDPASRRSPMRDPFEERLLHNIGRSTERLINLVNELLDMAQLRSGRVTLNLQRIHVEDILLDTAAQVRPLLDARGQRLSLDLPPLDSPRRERLVAHADRRRVEQVVLNLLSNAIKYGPTGSDIVLGATPRSGTVRVFVRDDGPGIAAHEQEFIFDKFYQGSGSPIARNESSGLGLAIARAIVELHGGSIGVTSRPGRGSTFYFTLPQDMDAADDRQVVAGLNLERH
jgi:signal transduction histidine kinase